MIQEIYPKIFNPQFKNHSPGDGAYALYFEGNTVLLFKDKLGNPTIPQFQDLKTKRQDEGYYLFSIDKDEYYLIDDPSVCKHSSFSMEPISTFRHFHDQAASFAGVTGGQIYRFLQSRIYCGHCGSKTIRSTTERAVICPNCGAIEYPKISPAIIVAITDGDRILLTKGRNTTYKHYALVAGFMEIGETPEDAVRREVMEEVGLKIKNIRAHKSQPWAFSDTLMMGFTAELDGDDTITLQEEELKEASWFERKDVPLPDSTISVGQEMIAYFKEGKL
jgi:hypothetical protein